jgi:hypothetical protein
MAGFKLVSHGLDDPPQVIISWSDEVQHMYLFDDQKGQWQDFFCDGSYLNEKNSFYLLEKLVPYPPYWYSLVQTYSILRFLLLREIISHHCLPRDLIAWIVGLSD